MVKRGPANLVLNAVRNKEQNALHNALLVPWHQLSENATAFAEWHMFILWVRAITETGDQIPEIVRSSLHSRCPGFLEYLGGQRSEKFPFWKFLEEWVTQHYFAKARTEGFLDAVIYYAYKDLRTEQAWTAWVRTNSIWRNNPPQQWPTYTEWTEDILSTRNLANADTEKARALRALSRVEPDRLANAVAGMLESRALALWVECQSTREHPLEEVVLAELANRCPALLPICIETPWGSTLFYRLIRLAEFSLRSQAKSEGWYSLLRYQVVHHPRYHRLIHYNQRCHDEWSRSRPDCYPSFSNWLSASDKYYIGRKD